MFVKGGPLTWSGQQTKNLGRTYKVKFRVQGEIGDGPARALQATGLPTIGSAWVFYGTTADEDVWAFFTGEMSVTPAVENEKNYQFLVECSFATPDAVEGSGNSKRCNDSKIEDPLLEPPAISGDFVNYTAEAALDYRGRAIVNSAWERIRGPQNEWDNSRPTVKIEHNTPALQLGTVAAMMDCVNAYPLWGLPPRCVKLSKFSWERKYYGTCYAYYTRSYEFQIQYETFDRYVLDEANKVLNGRWGAGGNWVVDDIYDGVSLYPADPNNPTHFIASVDRQNNPTTVILNGHGVPAYVDVGSGTVTTSQAGYVLVKKYLPADFAALGIPLSLEG